MALATRRAPNVHHKKRVAQHHKHGKSYVKTYLPYLPLLVVGLSIVINKIWYILSPGINSGLVNSSVGDSLSLTRIQVLTGDYGQTMLVGIIAISTLAFTVLVSGHSRRLHLLLSQGEKFVYKHPWLDFGCLVISCAGLILTRPNGITN
ncbi:MAG TPA: hypothetical protein VLF79_03710 [Candidatus Saccharimonadales bacterium]|nr:hypothetical protein [Candidatus Saccharimonadales bacterium]